MWKFEYFKSTQTHTMFSTLVAIMAFGNLFSFYLVDLILMWPTLIPFALKIDIIDIHLIEIPIHTYNALSMCSAFCENHTYQNWYYTQLNRNEEHNLNQNVRDEPVYRSQYSMYKHHWSCKSFISSLSRWSFWRTSCLENKSQHPLALSLSLCVSVYQPKNNSWLHRLQNHFARMVHVWPCQCQEWLRKQRTTRRENGIKN